MAFVCVCVCVRERERDGNRKKVLYCFDVWLTVHRSSMWNKEPPGCHLVLYLFLLYKLLFISCSTCFGPPCAHLQELKT